jgi:hypothetical protein
MTVAACANDASEPEPGIRTARIRAADRPGLPGQGHSSSGHGPVLMHLPELADTAAPGAEAMTVRHLLSVTAGNDYCWVDEDADHPGDPARGFLATPLVAEPGTA